MLSQAVVLLALTALSCSAPTPTKQPGLCLKIQLFQRIIREVLPDLRKVEILGTATIPVNTMEKGCIHSHLSKLLEVLSSLDSNIVKKLLVINNWTKEQMEFQDQGSSEECQTAETMHSEYFMKKTSEFLRFLHQELSCQSQTTTPNP